MSGLSCYIVCATWCKPCKEIAPQILASWERFGQDVAAFQKLDYDEMDDWGPQVAGWVGDVNKLPTIVVVAADGTVKGRITENQVALFVDFLSRHLWADKLSDDF
jgi:thiol-disulfide isomerase/thioredoxin